MIENDGPLLTYTASQEIQSLFDPQVEGILKKVTEQFDWLKNNGHPQQVVSSWHW